MPAVPPRGISNPPPGISTPQGGNSNPFGDLTDPATWMALVKDQGKREAWLKSFAGPLFQAKPDLLPYYSQKLVEQPGANAAEQAGSAAYWTNKVMADPNYPKGPGSPAPSVAGAPSTMPSGSAPRGTQAVWIPGRVNAATKPGVAGPDVQNPGQTYSAAYLALLRQRGKTTAGGRSSTVFGGFKPGAPATRAPSLMGYR